MKIEQILSSLPDGSEPIRKEGWTFSIIYERILEEQKFTLLRLPKLETMTAQTLSEQFYDISLWLSEFPESQDSGIQEVLVTEPEAYYILIYTLG